MAKAPVNTAARRVSKKVRKNVADGIAHVHASFNNTIITITDRQPLSKPPAGRALSEGKEEPQAAFPSWCFPAQTKRRTEGIRVPVPLACGGSSTARVLLRLCPESACQTGPSLELSSRLEAGGCAVRASPGGLGSLAQPQRRGTRP